MTRICNTCQLEKPIEEYYLNASCYGGRRPKCGQCCRDDSVYYRKRHKAALLAENLKQNRMNDESREAATKHRQPWTNEQDAFVREFWETEGVLDIAEALGRTMMAIRARASYLGLKRAVHLPYRTE